VAGLQGAYKCGLSDSFRVVHPNPVAKPGFTWTPCSPEGEKVEVHDRIDWVLSMLATATASKVVGEGGNPNTCTHNTIEGSTTFDANSLAGWKTWDEIGTGTYQIRLLLDDGYRSAAVSPPFRVAQP
jgi:hypothetical protein